LTAKQIFHIIQNNLLFNQLILLIIVNDNLLVAFLQCFQLFDGLLKTNAIIIVSVNKLIFLIFAEEISHLNATVR